MVCIYCDHKTAVINSRPQHKTKSTWRRRQCLNCASVFTTVEKPSLDQALRVSNTSGNLQPFSQSTLFVSILLSVPHQKNPPQEAEALTNTVLQHLLKEVSTAVLSTELIKQTVAKVLKNYDHAALIQYKAFNHLR